jgi:hypothetical protein
MSPAADAPRRTGRAQCRATGPTSAPGEPRSSRRLRPRGLKWVRIDSGGQTSVVKSRFGHPFDSVRTPINFDSELVGRCAGAGPRARIDTGRPRSWMGRHLTWELYASKPTTTPDCCVHALSRNEVCSRMSTVLSRRAIRCRDRPSRTGDPPHCRAARRWARVC